MICPGVKRPPPMGSELVSGLPDEPVRGVRAGVDEDDGLRGGGAAGAIVSPSMEC